MESSKPNPPPYQMSSTVPVRRRKMAALDQSVPAPKYAVTSKEISNVKFLGSGADGCAFRCRYTGDNQEFREKYCKEEIVSKPGVDPVKAYFFILKIPKAKAEINQEQNVSNHLSEPTLAKEANKADQPSMKDEVQEGGLKTSVHVNQACGIVYQELDDNGHLFGKNGLFTRGAVTENGRVIRLNDLQLSAQGPKETLALASKFEVFEAVPYAGADLVPTENDPAFTSGDVLSFFKDIFKNNGRLKRDSAFSDDLELTLMQVLYAAHLARKEMHEKNTVWGDLALRNLLITTPKRNNNGVITRVNAVGADFGHSGVVDDIKTGGVVIKPGSPVPTNWCDQYLFQQSLATATTDFYAMRILFFEALALMASYEKNDPNVHQENFFRHFVRDGNAPNPNTFETIMTLMLTQGNEGALQLYTKQALATNLGPRSKALLNAFLPYFKGKVEPNEQAEELLLGQTLEALITGNLITKLKKYDAVIKPIKPEDYVHRELEIVQAILDFSTSMNRIMEQPIHLLANNKNMMFLLEPVAQLAKLPLDEKSIKENPKAYIDLIDAIKVRMTNSNTRLLMFDAIKYIEDFTVKLHAAEEFMSSPQDPTKLSLDQFNIIDPETGNIALQQLATLRQKIDEQLQKPIAEIEKKQLREQLTKIDETLEIIQHSTPLWNSIKTLEIQTVEAEKRRQAEQIKKLAEKNYSALKNVLEKKIQTKDSAIIFELGSVLKELLAIYRTCAENGIEPPLNFDKEIRELKVIADPLETSFTPIWDEFTRLYQNIKDEFKMGPRDSLRRSDPVSQQKDSPLLVFTEQVQFFSKKLASVNVIVRQLSVAEGSASNARKTDLKAIQATLQTLKNIRGQIESIKLAWAQCPHSPFTNASDVLAIGILYAKDVASISNNIDEWLKFDTKKITETIQTLEDTQRYLLKHPQEKTQPLVTDYGVLGKREDLITALQETIKNAINKDHNADLIENSRNLINNFFEANGSLRKSEEFFGPQVNLSDQDRILLKHFLEPYQIIANHPAMIFRENDEDTTFRFLEEVIDQDEQFLAAMVEAAKNKNAFFNFLNNIGAQQFKENFIAIESITSYMAKLSVTIEAIAKNPTIDFHTKMLLPTAVEMTKQYQVQVKSLKPYEDQNNKALFKARKKTIQTLANNDIRSAAAAALRHIEELNKSGKLTNLHAQQISLQIRSLEAVAIDAGKPKIMAIFVKSDAKVKQAQTAISQKQLVASVFKGLSEATSKEEMLQAMTQITMPNETQGSPRVRRVDQQKIEIINPVTKQLLQLRQAIVENPQERKLEKTDKKIKVQDNKLEEPGVTADKLVVPNNSFADPNVVPNHGLEKPNNVLPPIVEPKKELEEPKVVPPETVRYNQLVDILNGLREVLTLMEEPLPKPKKQLQGTKEEERSAHLVNSLFSSDKEAPLKIEQPESKKQVSPNSTTSN